MDRVDREIAPNETWRDKHEVLAKGVTSDGQSAVFYRPRDEADRRRDWVTLEVGNHFQLPIPFEVVEQAGGALAMAAAMGDLDYSLPDDAEVPEDRNDEPPILRAVVYPAVGGAETYRTIVTDLTNRAAS